MTQHGPWAQTWQQAVQPTAAHRNAFLQGSVVHLADEVSGLDLALGTATALVTAHQDEPARARLDLAPFTTDEQAVLGAALAAGPHREPLLAGHLPAALTDSDHTGGVAITPHPGHFAFACSCGQAPCRHTAALAHAVTDRLNTDPMLLLVLRGLPQQRLAQLLHDHAPGVRPKRLRQFTAFVPAHQAFQARPAAPPSGRAAAAPVPEAAAVFADAPLTEPPHPAPPLAQLRHLTALAAVQARHLLEGRTTLDNDPVCDAVRTAADLPGAPKVPDLAHRLGLEPEELRLLLAAHEVAGAAGVRAARARFPADPALRERAEQAIGPLRPSSRTPLTVEGNRITDTPVGVQIRVDADGSWYPFTAADGDWRLAGPAARDAAGAYRDALASRRTRTKARSQDRGQHA
ncbi:hypothetical protein PUR61_16425 [Streptomyces sp. BE20]|uniref:hypothetical protein n=1 Tax=Streptomyces sp. BE20 TaxID=3002525 RepID=UPI002E7A4FF1|nr:hypothetical protein [Streptomyces sp. BE20]MEE1823764.1 hypothetical protein [Streptomyces sp. BE20]